MTSTIQRGRCAYQVSYDDGETWTSCDGIMVTAFVGNAVYRMLERGEILEATANAGARLRRHDKSRLTQPTKARP